MGLQFAIVDPHHDGIVFCLIISTCVFILKLQETIVESNKLEVYDSKCDCIIYTVREQISLEVKRTTSRTSSQNHRPGKKKGIINMADCTSTTGLGFQSLQAKIL